jgi:hypothetical protein
LFYIPSAPLGGAIGQPLNLFANDMISDGRIGDSDEPADNPYPDGLIKRRAAIRH